MARKSSGWWNSGIGGLAGGGMQALWPHLRLEETATAQDRVADCPGPPPRLRPAGGLAASKSPPPGQRSDPARPRP